MQQHIERGELLKLKSEEHEKYGYPASDEFYLWYVSNIIFVDDGGLRCKLLLKGLSVPNIVLSCGAELIQTCNPQIL